MAIYIPVSVLWTIQVSSMLLNHIAFRLKQIPSLPDSPFPVASGGHGNVPVRVCPGLDSDASDQNVEIFPLHCAHHRVDSFHTGCRIHADLFPSIGYTRNPGCPTGGTGEGDGGNRRCPQECYPIE